MPRLRSDLGQAALDYVAVLAVAGIALTAGAGVAMAKGGQLAGSVRSQMVRALCIVTSGDCDRDRAPCVVGSKETTKSLGAEVVVVRLGGSRVALIAERSDGRVDVTLVDGIEIGLGRSLGRQGRLALLGQVKGGMSWTVDSLAAARELVDRVGGVSDELLRSLAGGGLVSDPDTISLEAGYVVDFGVEREGEQAKGSLQLGRSFLTGGRYDRRTGHTTVYLKKADELLGALEATTPAGKAEGAGRLGRGAVMAVELDRDGRPVDLMLLQTGEYEGSFSLPGVAAEVAGYLGVPSELSRRYEVERHLDLTVAANAGATERFLAAALGLEIAAPQLDPAIPTRLLADRLFRHGTVDARTYEVDRSGDTKGFSLGPISGEKGTEELSSRLLSAMTRGPDGTWQERTDCVER